MNDSSSSRSRNDASVVVDEIYFCALFDYDELFPISDEKYAVELHLQEALVSSCSTNLASTAENQETALLKMVKTEPDEPSRTFCIICMEDKSSSDIFRGLTKHCTHSFCTDCTARYVATKIRENAAMIKCPAVGCTRQLEPYTCRDLVPGDVFERWERALCESLIMASERVYCPYEDCSAVIVDDGGNNTRETECPCCHRLFCAQCKVTWHAGIGCEEFRRLGNDEKKDKLEDHMVLELAKTNSWRRCPNCKFYVEKISGCLHITCRCGNQFCYGCGSVWNSDHSCNRI